MTVQLYAFECGRITLATRFLLSGATGNITIPVPAFLVIHPAGKVLFDSGLNRMLLSDPAGYIGERAADVSVDFAPGQEISTQLALMDMGAADITHLVNSHLHLDHAGGNDQIPNAPVYVQAREWHWAQDPPGPGPYEKRDYSTGQEMKLIDGEHDLFGDGSVTCIPTYGHTPGHQSLRVRSEGGEFFLTADACYMRRTLEQLHLPEILHDADQMLATLHRLRRYQAAGAHMIFGHDPESWETVPRAPRRVG